MTHEFISRQRQVVSMVSRVVRVVGVSGSSRRVDRDRSGRDRDGRSGFVGEKLHLEVSFFLLWEEEEC